MCLLVESIKIQNRIPQNVDYHNARLNRSRCELFGIFDRIDLREVLRVPSHLSNTIYKCRVVYNSTIQYQEYVPYTPRIIKTLQLAVDDDIDYTYKYLDRTRLDILRTKSQADDILIVKHDRITDASSANVVFFNGATWVTPAKPLLKGTKRQFLLDREIIHVEDIPAQSLRYFQKAVLINAMIDFNEQNFVNIQNILNLDTSIL
jgi:4-amino-4-deoxychorismate lyase